MLLGETFGDLINSLPESDEKAMTSRLNIAISLSTRMPTSTEPPNIKKR